MVLKLGRFFYLSDSSFELDSSIGLEELSSSDSVEFIGPPKMNLYLYHINLPMHFLNMFILKIQ